MESETWSGAERFGDNMFTLSNRCLQNRDDASQLRSLISQHKMMFLNNNLLYLVENPFRICRNHLKSIQITFLKQGQDV